MVELFDKLLENDFSVYVVTATERNIVRAVIQGTLRVPASHVIGTDYGYTAAGRGIGIISMRDDFKTIYGDEGIKTGIVPNEGTGTAGTAAEPEAEMDGAGQTGSVQYVLYLGTNGKDTNKPVFTQAGAMQAAKDILIRRFGGCTIQEAQGGWIGDDGRV